MLSDLFGAELSEIRLCECGRERCSPLKDIVSKSKEYHVLHYVLGGKGTFILGGKEYTLTKGDAFYIPPYATPRYFPDKQKPWMYVWVGFDGTYAQHYLKAMGLSSKDPIYRDKKDMPLRALFNDLADRFNATGRLTLDCLAATLRIFYNMMTLSSEEAQDLSVKERHVREAQDFIANNYQFSITVQGIADSLGLTPNYLANVFGEVLGTSPKQYLTVYRMEKASRLLTSADLSIKEVAAKVGYDNQFHFSAEFKRVKKASPTIYRKNNLL